MDVLSLSIQEFFPTDRTNCGQNPEKTGMSDVAKRDKEAVTTKKIQK